jgi:PAS domain S-box-containing protein
LTAAAASSAETLFGYNQDDLIDQTVELLIPHRFRERHIEHRQDYSAEPRIRPMGERLDLVGRRSDGDEIPLRVGLSYIKNNDDVLVIALITEAIVLGDQDAYAEILYPTAIPTKIRRPKLISDYIPRPDLIKRLNNCIDRSLILVIAPAGYGKTTLVSSWLEENDCSSVWLTLDETDNDLALFLSTFIVALNEILPDACPSTNSMAQRSSLAPLPVLSASLVKELDAVLQTNQTGEELVFVLDDYHNIRNADIHRLLKDLLRNALPGFHLVVASRRDPSLGLSTLRALGRIAEFRVEDLATTPIC